MAEGVARKGDELDDGDAIIDGPCSNNVFINSKKAALKGDATDPDVGDLDGSRNVYVNGEDLQANGDETTLGSVITEASDNVFVG